MFTFFAFHFNLCFFLLPSAICTAFPNNKVVASSSTCQPSIIFHAFSNLNGVRLELFVYLCNSSNNKLGVQLLAKQGCTIVIVPEAIATDWCPSTINVEFGIFPICQSNCWSCRSRCNCCLSCYLCGDSCAIGSYLEFGCRTTKLLLLHISKETPSSVILDQLSLTKGDPEKVL